MASNSSFDISTGVDLQEVDNAVNMATKEIATRYDFKGKSCTLELDRKEGAIKLDADTLLPGRNSTRKAKSLVTTSKSSRAAEPVSSRRATA